MCSSLDLFFILIPQFIRTKTGALSVTAALINKDVSYDRSNSLQLRQSDLQNKCNFCYKERHFLNGRLWEIFYGYVKISVQGTYSWRERNCIIFCAIKSFFSEKQKVQFWANDQRCRLFWIHNVPRSNLPVRYPGVSSVPLGASNLATTSSFHILYKSKCTDHHFDAL